jgi:hypothetical protein
MKDGGKKKKVVVEPYKIVDSSKSDWLKAILPSNIAQAVSKTFFGDARMSNQSLTDDQKLILWDTIENAKKRTGSNQGGTEYQDYGGLGHGTSKQYTEWFNKGNIPFVEGVAATLKNPGFELASTIGRGNYRTDPNDPNTVTYTDVYDWNKGEKMFEGNKAYKILRNALRNNEESNLNVEKNDPYRMNFKLNKAEVNKIRKKVHPLNMLDATAKTHLQTLPFRISPLKDGGWLEKYNDGGPIQPNYNDSNASAGPGFEGDGYSNVGRNYSPAWGGQFKEGGNLSFINDPKLRNMLEGYKPGFLETVGDYRLPEGQIIPLRDPSTEVSISVGGGDGEPAYLIPSFKYGQPLQDPVQEFNMTEQYLGGPFKTVDDAETFRELRHQYVDKGQPLPSPIATSNMAMGGSIGGATQGIPGATGFMYARTGTTPSNGKYAKKTKASAQNGTEMKYYQEGLDFKPKSISRDGDNIAYSDNTRVGNIPRYTRPSNYQGNQPDTLGENIFEIIDPSGISSWDDIYRSYNKTGMSGQTAIEAFGAIPFLGKATKFGKAVDALSTGFAVNKRQKRNAKVAAELLKATGKYGPGLGRASDAAQAYAQRNDYEQGGQLTKLDQLSNFTNYNTKQPGSWLDKYQ